MFLRSTFFVLASVLATSSTHAQEPPREWIDPATGHRVVRLSDEPGSSSLYFHQNGYTATGDKLVFTTNNGISAVDLKTHKIESLVEGRCGSIVVGKKTRQVFYMKDGTVYATHVDTHVTRAIVTRPELRGGSGLTVNADETLLAGSYVVGGPRPSPSPSAGTAAAPPPVEPSLEERWAARLPRELYTIDIATGNVKTFHPSTDWLNHVQFSPTDPQLLMFCHEGPWHKVDRIWNIRTDGTGLRLIHARTLDMEIAGHEFWSPDGTTVWFDLQTPKGEEFWLGGVVLATGEKRRYKLERNQWSVHFNVAPDGKTFAGDGGGPQMVAKASDGQWIYLFHPEHGVVQWERLVNMSAHDYKLEPNVNFTPDQKWIVFRSNMHGATQVYAVEVAKAAAAVSAQAAAPARGPSLLELQRGFEQPPDDSRIMMRWWWFGPAVTKPELERELRAMKAGGIGGFEVQPVYPVALDDARTGVHNLPYLSDEFIDALRFVAVKARELGLRMDLTIGSGWPYGGPSVPIGQAASRLRVERVKVDEHTRRVPLPALTEGEAFIAAFTARLQDQALVAGSVHEIPAVDVDRALESGGLQFPTGVDGAQEVQFYIASRTGMMVKRAALGAEGYVLDHYDRAATDSYLKNVGDRLMQAFDEQLPPYAVFCDSLEVYGADWTPDFLASFKRLRGYDLRPHLPALALDAGPTTAAVRRDWGKTLTELLNERFLAPMHSWAQRNHTLFRLQGYGTPPATISSNAYADLPEGESAQWRLMRGTRWASSASHLEGRPVTSAETWTWLHSPAFAATPLDVKVEAHLHFLQGINQLIGHGWPYTAEGIAYPGWRFYAAGVFNDKNPWWLVMPDLSLYLQRLSFLLRQGQPANDVAIYLPNDDAWAHFASGRVNMIEALGERLGPDVVGQVLDAGFGIDFFDDEALAQQGRVEKDGLVLGPNRYRAVVLPGVEQIPPASYRKLEDFARAGGVLVATRRVPDVAPGLQASDAERTEIRGISERLFKGAAARGHLVEDEAHALTATLAGLLRPDVALSPAVPEIGFVHRTTADADVYFLANTTNVRKATEATFRTERTRAEWWSPLSGRVEPARARPGRRGGLAVALALEPYEARVLIFSKRVPPASPAHTVSAVPAPLDLSSGWRVSFGDRPAVEKAALRSWTEDDETRYFSGVATYTRDVEIPQALLATGLALRLDFGDTQPVPEGTNTARPRAYLEAPVREAAVVYVNEHRAGSVWGPPYAIDVTGLLHQGRNTLRVEVGNLALNYMAGHALPDYRLLNLRYGVRFEAQDMDKVQPTPSGLLGKIRLIAAPRHDS